MRLNATKLGSIANSRSFGDQLFDLAGEVPNLDLNFAGTKTLNPQITFTRASSGTYVGADGLVKSAVTNLLLRSEEFDQWTASNITVTANNIAAPNGLLTADLFDDGTTAAVSHRVLTPVTVSFTSGVTYTFSLYVKNLDKTFVQLAFGSTAFGATAYANFNVSTGIVGTVGASATASITVLPDGWYRCTLSYTATSTALDSAFIAAIPSATSARNESYTGSNKKLYFWGAQLEASATPGDYVPTTSTINSAPRFDHNPITGESLGLLVEEARTNLILQSENFSDASLWIPNAASITPNTATAPDGTTTADLWTNTSTPGIVHQVYTKDTVARTYTGSLWVKPLTGSGLTSYTVSIDDGTTSNRGRATFNLNTGNPPSVLTDGTIFTNTSGTITRHPNNWYRLTVTTTTGTGTTIRLRPFFSITGGTVNVWGAQLEEAAFATSYIPTTTATVTRAADVTSITGANFSSWYNQTEGTFFVDSNQAYLVSARILSASDNSANNRIQLSRGAVSSGNIQLGVTTGGAAQVSNFALATSIAAGTSNKAAGSYKAADFAGSVNGLTAVTQGTGTVPNTLTQLAIGSGEVLGSLPMTGTIKRLTYWPVRLADPTLQSITSP